MSQPAYPKTYSQIPSRTEENKIKKFELQQQLGPPKKIASKYVGSPFCPSCGCKLKTKTAKSHTTEWILQCMNLHAWRVSLANGLTFQKIADSDPSFPRRLKADDD